MSRSNLHHPLPEKKKKGVSQSVNHVISFPFRESDHRKNTAARAPPPKRPEIFFESAPERKAAVGDCVGVGTAVESVRPVGPVVVADAVALCELAKVVTNSSNIAVWLALQ